MGPFYIEGAEYGDTLEVHLDKAWVPELRPLSTCNSPCESTRQNGSASRG
jgi:acetamidase/formamidase